MTLPLRRLFDEVNAEGVLVSCSNQEGERWRILMWDGQVAQSAAVRHPDAEVVWEPITRNEIITLIEIFENEGVPADASDLVLATDGEVWDIVTKRTGEHMVWVNLVNPELKEGKSKVLLGLARTALGAY
jgi:hypothetical protein